MHVCLYEFFKKKLIAAEWNEVWNLKSDKESMFFTFQKYKTNQYVILKILKLQVIENF